MAYDQFWKGTLKKKNIWKKHIETQVLDDQWKKKKVRLDLRGKSAIMKGLKSMWTLDQVIKRNCCPLWACGTVQELKDNKEDIVEAINIVRWESHGVIGPSKVNQNQ